MIRDRQWWRHPRLRSGAAVAASLSLAVGLLVAPATSSSAKPDLPSKAAALFPSPPALTSAVSPAVAKQRAAYAEQLMSPKAPPYGTMHLMMQDNTYILEPSTRDTAIKVAKDMGARMIRIQIDARPSMEHMYPVWSDAIGAVIANGLVPYITLHVGASYGVPAHNGYCPPPGQYINNTFCIPQETDPDYATEWPKFRDGWINWVYQMARWLHGRVWYWSTWNEPNHGRQGGGVRKKALTPRQYREIYAGTYNAIKGFDSRNWAFLGELAGVEADGGPGAYLQDTLCADGPDWQLKPGCVRFHTDGLAVHPYQFDRPPAAELPEDYKGIGKLWQYQRAMERAATGVRPAILFSKNHALPPPVLITEFGYASVYDKNPSSRPYLGEEIRGVYTRDAYRMARDRYQVPIFTYYHLLENPYAPDWDSGIVSWYYGYRPAALYLKNEPK